MNGHFCGRKMEPGVFHPRLSAGIFAVARMKRGGSILFTGEEKRKDDVAQAAGDPNGYKEEYGNKNTLKCREGFRLHPKDVKQRSGRAEQDMASMRIMGLAGEKGPADAQQRGQVDDQRHFDDADMRMGVLHSKQPLPPVGNEAVAQRGNPDRPEVADEYDGNHAGLGVVRSTPVVLVERCGNHRAQHNVQGMGKLEQGIGPFRVDCFGGESLEHENDGDTDRSTQQRKGTVMLQFFENG